jgi:tetratricopeptide (TPR) repeat protein
MSHERASLPSTGLPDKASSDRLDSWKDVAAYLKRDVSTVQRWEKRERMPVHRHVHDKVGTVYAFRAELDAWFRDRGSLLTEPDAPVSKPAATGRGALFGALVTLALVAATGYLLLFGRSSNTTTSEITAAERAVPGTQRPVNPEAYEYLLRARYLSVRTTDADNRAALAHLEHAIALDPGFAAAYGELAAAYVTRLAYVTPDESADLEQKAFAAAERALSLDPTVPEAYLARGDLLWTQSQRFAHERAVQEFRRALAINPNSDQAHRRLARVFVHLGFFEEALEHANIALKINPSNAQALNTRAQALLWMGNDEAALEMLLGMPGPVLPELVEANTVFALIRLNRREEAWVQVRKALSTFPHDPSGNLPGVEAILSAESEPHKAEAFIQNVTNRTGVNPSHHAAYFAAAALARMGRAEQAVRWLRDAAATGFPCYALFARDPTLDPIRGAPVFQAFLSDLQKKTAALHKALFPERIPAIR